MILALYRDRIRLLQAQLGHLSDGREYQLQTHRGGGWKYLAGVKGTAVCDACTTWLITNGAGRVRALPAKNQPTAEQIISLLEKQGWRGVHIDTESESGFCGIPPPPKVGFPCDVPNELIR